MGQYTLLDAVCGDSSLKSLKSEQIPALCAEIREFLLENVSKTGGHLASNLGVVELSVAAHRVFTTPRDCIMFDVGHQCYIHKILTGRRGRFDSLRSLGGMSGFLRPDESEHDCFVSGHASNSISACLGLARAKKLTGSPGRVVCVIGDGALTGGMAFEALNDAGQSGEPLIIIFNDNDMSISRNVGAVAGRLAKMRLKPRYFRAKSQTKAFFSRFKWGARAIRAISALKQRVRVAILKESLFEHLGFRYLGPADGNDPLLAERLLREAAAMDVPVVVHFKTVKGKGYLPSERSPHEYHGVSPFDARSGTQKPGEIRSFSSEFGRLMCLLGRENPRICAVTAAMTDNTGLRQFASEFPQRFFDVAIAEEHAVTMSAGLAAGGLAPVCALYSTFLQRGYDQLIHDVAIAKNPVVFAVDRAGIVGPDGVTHQGVFDISFLLSVPGMAVFAPSSLKELHSALRKALDLQAPAAVRYPRGGEREFRGDSFCEDCALLGDGRDVAIISYGIMINEALRAAKSLEESGFSARVIKINRLDSFDFTRIACAARETGRIIVAEDAVDSGGVGRKIASELAVRRENAAIRLLNLGDGLVREGKVDELYTLCKISAADICAAALEMINGK